MNIREKYILEKKGKKPKASDDEGSSFDINVYNVMRVGEKNTKTKIGELERNFWSLYDTWEPFEQNGKEYALCSTKYTGTSVIALPSCKIIVEEPEDSFGFCPTAFYVPQDAEIPYKYGENNDINGQFGFVAGCLWGDDSSWKVQFLDLSEIKNGKLYREQRFGYVELAEIHDSSGEYYSLKDRISISSVSDGKYSMRILSNKEFNFTVSPTVVNRMDEATDKMDLREETEELAKYAQYLFKKETSGEFTDEERMRYLKERISYLFFQIKNKYE